MRVFLIELKTKSFLQETKEGYVQTSVTLSSYNIEIQILGAKLACSGKDRFMNSKKTSNNPLHGITLEKIVTELSDFYGWKKLSKEIEINCFKSNPSIKSSLTFLRRNEWARKKVENLYLDYLYYDKKT